MKHRSHRHPSNYNVMFRSNGKRASATLVDINERGARLIAGAEFSVGQPITIAVLHYELQGLVRWAGGGRAGISFYPHLPPRAVDVIRQATTHAGHLPRFDSSHLREMR